MKSISKDRFSILREIKEKGIMPPFFKIPFLFKSKTLCYSTFYFSKKLNFQLAKRYMHRACMHAYICASRLPFREVIHFDPL